MICPDLTDKEGNMALEICNGRCDYGTVGSSRFRNNCLHSTRLCFCSSAAYCVSVVLKWLVHVANVCDIDLLL